MANDKQIRVERIKNIAKGRYGRDLIEWIEEIVNTYADVRSVHASISFDTRKDAVNIIENEIVKPLKAWNRNHDIKESGDDSE